MFRRDDGDDVNCGTGGGDTTKFGLRVASVFIVMVGSMFGAFFPVLTRRTKWLAPRVPKGVFDFAKYFGSGVIVSSLASRSTRIRCSHNYLRSPLRSFTSSTPRSTSSDRHA